VTKIENRLIFGEVIKRTKYGAIFGPPCVYIGLYGKLISELWSVICHMGSHSVTCHPTQV